MDHFEPRFLSLISRMLDAELSADEEAELLHLCEHDSARADRLREELELAEWLRQAVRSEAESSASMVDPVRAMIGAPPELEFEELHRRLLSGDCDDVELEQVVAHCWRDRGRARELYRSLQSDDLLHQVASSARSEEAFIESLATRMWAEEEEDGFVGEVASKIIALHPELSEVAEISELPAASANGSNVTYFGGWAAAAAAVILLVGAILFQPAGSGPLTSVAEMTRSEGEVRWAPSGATPIYAEVEEQGRYHIVPGRYSLESGVVTFAFASGAEMTVEGPAEFDVLGEQEAFVHSGVAVLAKNSSSGNRFRLQTDALDLGDRGDMIGLVANGSSSAEAVIFDGDGRVCLPDLGMCRQMFALEPVRADRDREKLFDIPYNPGVFAKAWQVNAGVETNQGPVNLVIPGSRKGEVERSDDVQVFVEKSHFIAADDIEVDTLDPGLFAEATPSDGKTLKSGGVALRSYLLQLLPEGTEPGKDVVEASITFDHEIVGVIYTPERLEGSDALVGANSDQFAAAGVEFRGLDLAGSGDQILLSDDRRTVNLKLNSDDRDSLDHVRVLVALR